MKSPRLAFLFLFVANLGFATCQAVEWPFIKLTADNLSRVYPAVTVEIADDPVYQTRKKYQAIALRPLVQKLAEHYPASLQQAALVFTALDGYQAVMPYATVIDHDGFLAFKDLSARTKNWQPFRFGQETITPAPFYLVWPDIKKTDKWRFAWPFQLALIQLKPGHLVYAGAAPASQDKTLLEGFSLFSRFCIRCHAVNGAGGSVGPDLNQPVNPTTLYSGSILRQRILNAKKFNPATKMPVFETLLTRDQTEKIIRYLASMHLQEATTDAIP